MGKNKDTRRDFLKASATGIVGACVMSPSPLGSAVFGKTTAALATAPANKFPGRVVVNYNKDAIQNGKPDEKTIKDMTDDSIMLLTGKSTVAEAWKEIFPATLSATSKIAIHDPCGWTGDDIKPSPYIFVAVVNGLLSMDLNGQKLPASNISIYDRGGPNSLASRGITADKFPAGIKFVDNAPMSNHGDGAGGREYVNVLFDADFLINIFRLSGHTGSCDGFSLGCKAHFGTYPTSNHNNSVFTDINANGPVPKKEVLSICSGIYGTFQYGNHMGQQGNANFSKYVKTLDASSNSTNPTTIVMSTDLVSAEMQSIKIMKIGKGDPYDMAALPGYLKSITGVGVIDETQMEVRKLTNQRYVPVLHGNMTAGSVKKEALSVRHLPGQHNTQIEYLMPAWHVGKEARIEIVNMKGSVVRVITSRVLGRLTNCAWDERNEAGAPVARGTYLVRLTLAQENLSSTVTVM